MKKSALLVGTVAILTFALQRPALCADDTGAGAARAPPN